MQKSLIFTAIGLAAAATGAHAQNQEVGRVLSSTPVIQQVAVPRQVCQNQQVMVQQPRASNGVGAVIGAVAGGLLGNTIGGGSGRAVATAIGAVGGAAVGDSVQNNGYAYGSQMQNVQQCATQTYYENRTAGYNVVYEYGGKQYNVQMPYDPGPTIRLQVTPVGSAPEVQAPAYADAQTAPVYGMSGVPATVVYDASYPTYAPAPATPYYGGPAYPYVSPVGISLNLGYSSGYHGGYRGGHRGHWR